MKKIFVTSKLLRINEERLSKISVAKLNLNDEAYSQNKIIELSKGCDGILSFITDKIDRSTIEALPESIKIISNYAVGFGNIDCEAAKKRNIVVTNTPDVLTDATAEIAILLILGAARRANEGKVKSYKNTPQTDGLNDIHDRFLESLPHPQKNASKITITQQPKVKK